MLKKHSFFTNFVAIYDKSAHRHKKIAMGKPIITKRQIELDRLEENTGQLPGLPENPRYITEDKFDKLKANIANYL